MTKINQIIILMNTQKRPHLIKNSNKYNQMKDLYWSSLKVRNNCRGNNNLNVCHNKKALLKNSNLFNNISLIIRVSFLNRSN